MTSMRETNEQLADRIHRGDGSAYESLLERVEGFVWKYVIRYVRALRLDAHEKEDMLQEGRMLVYEAAKKFQIERGHKFTTYLSFHLHKLNGIANEFGVIRVPRPQGHGVSAAEDRKRDFRRKLMSIDAPRDDHDEGLVRILPAPTPYDHGFDEEKLPEWLHKLTIRERLVVMSRAEGFTLGDTGKLLGLTKERIRQIETAAIEHLRVMAGIANAKEEKRVLGRIQYRETMQRAAERRQVASMESAAI